MGKAEVVQDRSTVSWRRIPGRALLAGLLPILVSAPLLAQSADTLAAPAYYTQVCRAFARRFPAEHLLQRPLGRNVSAMAWTNYLSSLDYDHSYFLQSDIAEFEPYRLTLSDALREGDMEFAFAAFNVFRKRLDERYTFVTNRLASGFDFSVDESYVWKRRDADWPADTAAQDELWRKRIKNEYLGYKVSRMLAAESATNAPAASSDGGDDAGTSTNEPAVTAERFVDRRYAQYRMVIEDSDAEWVLQRFLSSFTSAFDPHSAYMSPSSLEDFDIEMKLSLVGIGALLRSEDGAARIVSLIPGGPAIRDKREVRLQPGDKIIGVGQGKTGGIEDVLHLPLYKIVRKIRGEKGTVVRLLVIPASDPSGASTKVVDLVRDEVKLEEQAADGELRTLEQDGRTLRLGVVKLPAFYASMQTRDTAAPDYRSATLDVSRIIAGFNEEQIDGMLLDLRNNGGGSLREAIEMTGLFIRTGPVVQVRQAREIHLLPDRDPAVAMRKPMVVLVNRLSASASEIVAGALQDYGRAVLVGDSSTHGKGSVQTIYPLGEDKRLGVIKVTTASYYRITGSSTQLRGVTPDVVIPSTLDYMEVGESNLPNAMPWSRVAPAVYEPVAYLSDVIRQLRDLSQERRSASERFKRYGKLVDHVKEVSESVGVPLELAARKRLAGAERELRRLEEPEPGDQENGKREDPILDESLQILADLIRMQGPLTSLEEPSEGGSEMLNDLMRRIFGR